jgi:hypothetical protein
LGAPRMRQHLSTLGINVVRGRQDK